ncbi:peroxiredoxin [Simkania negevensis]|uniref:Thioredoxin peroxidase n=1 Tax=Simkania negevensis (strain ATCC VR-1471 / DSM 27360 / Z) TaxID=331113 RepID=F8L487_SIMNZ|nr:peroxiredoxin [Simkania negevensis]MCB1075462.1 peroxiredoxin [Simkania sp.]MCP5490637.1 peroxiredoxin [Chlamydiales bacterium]CCB90133.1 peroxiredoxin-1 [Simkania negevensis Z]
MSSLLVGKKAPQFKAKAVANGQFIDDFSLDMYTNKHVLLFFYPLDFTFVCPTELHAFQDRLQDFHARETEVVGCSVDSHFTHLAWVNTPKNKGGIEGVTYPLVSDLNKSIARDFHVLNEAEGIAFRGLYLIDKKGIIRHQLINDLPIGRSVDEALRVIDALIFHEKHGDVCPANWKSGDKSMQPTQEGLSTYFG